MKINKGYNVLEVMVSALIIFVLILLAYYYYIKTQEDAKVAVFITNKRYIMLASYQYYLDKRILPSSLLDLFKDPYKDYLPKALSSYFGRSSWDSQIEIYSYYYPTAFVSYLYLEVMDLKKHKLFISNSTQKKLVYRLSDDFWGYKDIQNKEYMVFKLIYIVR